MTSSGDATLQTSLSTHVDSEDWVHFRFNWTIKKWSVRPEVNGEYLESPHFVTTDKRNSSAEWCVWVYPKGKNDETVSDDCLSVCLYLHAPSGRKVKATYGFWIVSDRLNNRIIGWGSDVFEAWENNGCAGRDNGFKLDVLCNPQNGYLPGDTLTIVCKGTYKDEDSIVPVNKSDVRDVLLDELVRRNILTLLSVGNQPNAYVCLSVSGREIHAHKHILANHTCVFADQLRIEITDHDYEVILEMVTFMYTRETRKLYSLTDKLLLAAIEYKVTDLQRACETVLVLNLTIHNAIPTLTLADEHSLHSLRTQVTDFISQHCREIVKTDTYKGLFGSHPQLAYELNAMLMQKLNI